MLTNPGNFSCAQVGWGLTHRKETFKGNHYMGKVKLPVPFPPHVPAHGQLPPEAGSYAWELDWEKRGPLR